MNVNAIVYLGKKLTTEIKNANELHNNTSKEKIIGNESKGIPSRMDEYLKSLEEGLPIIQSNELDEYVKFDGFAKIDFGSNVKFDALVSGEKIVLFKYKEPETKELKRKMRTKGELITFLKLDKKATLFDIADSLNVYVDDNPIRVQEGQPSISTNRNRKLNRGIALENIVEGIDQNNPDDIFWADFIEKLTQDTEYALSTGDPEEMKRVKTKLEGFEEKYKQIVVSNNNGELIENPYLKEYKGRITFELESVIPFLDELEEKNDEVAREISYESKGEPKLTLKGEFDFSDALQLSPRLKSFLTQTYKQNIEFRATIENENVLPEIPTSASMKP